MRHFIRGSIYLCGDKIQIGSTASARGPASICHGDATRRYRLARPRNYPRRARILQRTSVIYRAERSASCPAAKNVAARSLFSVFSSFACSPSSQPSSHPSFIFPDPRFLTTALIFISLVGNDNSVVCFFRVLPRTVFDFNFRSLYICICVVTFLPPPPFITVYFIFSSCLFLRSVYYSWVLYNNVKF